MKCPAQIAATVILAVIIFLQSGCSRDEGENANPPPNSNSVPNASSEPVVELSGDQLNAIKIAPVEARAFAIIKTGVGTVDFDSKLYSDASLSTPVFPTREGKILKMFVELGDEVEKNAPLYSVENSGADQSEIIIRSPIAGQITSVNLAAGLLASPSNTPAPVAVADVSKKWLLANVPEADAPSFQIGQKTEIKVAAFPDQKFDGKISKIYPTVDLTTHRLAIRAEIFDPANELRAGMLADFSAEVQVPVESVALPANGVVREGDGTMTAWTTTDKKVFTQKIIKVGLRENGEVQILDGLKQGELAATDGAIFLDNMLNAPPSD